MTCNLIIDLSLHLAQHNEDYYGVGVVKSLYKRYMRDISSSLIDSCVITNKQSFRIAFSGSIPIRIQYFNESGTKNMLNNIFLEQSTVILPENLDYLPPLTRSPIYRFVANANHQQLKRKEMLIVLTTCNQLKMTITAIEHLLFARPSADLIIVDDHSIGNRL